MLSAIFSQFGHPRGLLGQIVGWAMALKNRERTEWAVAQLHPQPLDIVLDIGCGPGVAVQQLATLTPRGLVAGLDISEVMVQQAQARNAAAVRAGRVVLKQGSVAQIPFANAEFDKVLAINSYRFWPMPVENLQEVWRVLKPGGWLAVVEQPMSATGEATIPALKEELLSRLSTVGFQKIELKATAMKPATCVCALARA